MVQTVGLSFLPRELGWLGRCVSVFQKNIIMKHFKGSCHQQEPAGRVLGREAVLSGSAGRHHHRAHVRSPGEQSGQTVLGHLGFPHSQPAVTRSRVGPGPRKDARREGLP